MPEGDSVATDAQRLRPLLLGETILAVGGTSPRVRSNSSRILDSSVADIRTVGKHLVVDFSSGYSLHVHRGMPGRWETMPVTSRPHGSARVVITTQTHHVACYSAPTVEVDRTALIDRNISKLGPDLLGEFEVDEFIRRARLGGDRPIATTLLDQRVMAGIGNVYKSELLFLARINPWANTDRVTDEQLGEIAREAQRLLAVNVGQRRSTTGSRVRGQETWVYEQAGHGCRRCGSAIQFGRLDDRVTYWCPSCQPPQAGGSPTV